MARMLLEIEDLPDGQVKVRFTGVDLRTRATLGTNTVTQNAAIYLLKMLREAGIAFSDLEHEGGDESPSSVGRL